MEGPVSINRVDDESPEELNSPEAFDCPICQEVFKTPIRTQTCKHVFCKNCFVAAVRTQGPHCPMCRGPVTENERRATDIHRQMKEKQGKCRACSTVIFFSKMRSHYKYCRLYKEEYGAPPATPVESRAQGIYVGITQATAADGLLSGNSAQPQAIENGSLETTFICPYCHQSGFTDMALVQHCNSNHFGDLTRVVCPICVAMPYGNPNYFSRNFISHLHQRHRISYGHYMNIHQDEDEQLQAAIHVSIEEWNASSLWITC
ncbi:E3 ubiquitin-protein ligase RNF138-like [Acipenser ruthenus]|uniref:E3 ubiquitin-protein ligase RNF138-like n=1 Tax=Acipenser ruthenus TaxID=7906 RepID=UPI0027428B43|nr:E3 ubiquitin-protein ligase RNF138-like [Acipenser ruthenus]